MKKQELVKLVLDSFEAEKKSDSAKGISLLHKDFKATDMFIGYDGKLFPSESGTKVRKAIKQVFQVTDRNYQFVSILADEKAQKVVVEFVESYTDPKTKKRFRTPLVAVVEVKNGKIWRTRHYTDPRLSHKYLTQKQINKALA